MIAYTTNGLGYDVIHLQPVGDLKTMLALTPELLESFFRQQPVYLQFRSTESKVDVQFWHNGTHILVSLGDEGGKSVTLYDRREAIGYTENDPSSEALKAFYAFTYRYGKASLWMLSIEDEHCDFGGSTSYPCVSEEAALRQAASYMTGLIGDSVLFNTNTRDAIRAMLAKGTPEDIREAMDAFEIACQDKYSYHEYGGRFYFSLSETSLWK